MPGKTTREKPATKSGNAGMGPNLGEGSQTGAPRYNEATHDFVPSGTVEKAAAEAARDLSGGESEALTQAEAEGKSHSRGEDPLLQRGQT